MTAYYNPNAPKKSANLSINSDLIQQAKALKINLSKLLEEKLAQTIATQKESVWIDENKEAIEEYNDRYEKMLKQCSISIQNLSLNKHHTYY